MKIDRISSTELEITSDLTKMPSGKADAEIAYWVLSAFQELERLRAEVKELRPNKLEYLNRGDPFQVVSTAEDYNRIIAKEALDKELENGSKGK